MSRKTEGSKLPTFSTPSRSHPLFGGSCHPWEKTGGFKLPTLCTLYSWFTSFLSGPCHSWGKRGCSKLPTYCMLYPWFPPLPPIPFFFFFSHFLLYYFPPSLIPPIDFLLPFLLTSLPFPVESDADMHSLGVRGAACPFYKE